MYFQWEEEEEEHRMMPKRTVSQIRPYMGSKKVFPSFFNQSMDGLGSFKPVANKITQLLHAQLPTLPRAQL
jgi:hypothetical protein